MVRGRRWPVAMLLALVVGLGGCAGAPKVGDGALDAAWAVLPKPVVPTPPAEVCSEGSAERVGLDLTLFRTAPIECAREHRSETYFVGTLSADAAARLPEPGDDLFRKAFESCAEQATGFLGGDYHAARVAIVPVLPTERQWRGEARWYRCEMLEITAANAGVQHRQSSLRGGLTGARPLAIGCVNQTLTADKKFIQELTFVGCTEAHDMELTGVYVAPDGAFPGEDALNKSSSSACLGVSASYLGMSKSALQGTGGISWVAWGGTEDAWAMGDRAFWCFLGPYPYRKMHASLKGKRPGSFPR